MDEGFRGPTPALVDQCLLSSGRQPWFRGLRTGPSFIPGASGLSFVIPALVGRSPFSNSGCVSADPPHQPWFLRGWRPRGRDDRWPAQRPTSAPCPRGVGLAVAAVQQPEEAAGAGGSVSSRSSALPCGRRRGLVARTAGVRPGGVAPRDKGNMFVLLSPSTSALSCETLGSVRWGTKRSSQDCLLAPKHTQGFRGESVFPGAGAWRGRLWTCSKGETRVSGAP